jgi:hypothetical protein
VLPSAKSTPPKSAPGMFTNGEWKKERNGFMEVEEIGTKAVEEPALASKGLRTARALCAMIGGKSYHGKQRRGPERMSKKKNVKNNATANSGDEPACTRTLRLR